MVLSGAPVSTLPLGAIPETEFVVTAIELGASVELNGRLAKDLGLLAESLSGWLTAAPRQWPTVVLQGRQGNVKSADEPREAPVELRISGHLQGSTVSDSRARFDTLKHVLVGAPVRVILPDAVTRYVVADVGTITGDPFGPQFRQRIVPVHITLTANDPFHYDLLLSEARGPAATRLPCALGTAPVRPKITIQGPATNPVVTLRDWTGASVATMTFGATSLLSTDLLVIDCAAQTVAKNGAALLSALTAGGFFKVEASAIADRDNSRWPTIETSSGVLLVQFVRSWR